MSKLDEVKEILRTPSGAELSNAAIAADVGCDEGLVRKARPLVEVDMLRDENARLKEELGRFRRAEKPPGKAPAARGPFAFYPLWEKITDQINVPVTTVKMIGE